jgi:hypothetical protein
LCAVIICQGCHKRIHQDFSNNDGAYKVDWQDGNVCVIQYKDKINPSHDLLINIMRSDNAKTVTINNKNEATWAKEILTPGADSGTDIGVVFHDEGSDPEIVEWRLEKDGFLIYKEQYSNDKFSRSTHVDFFGPGGVALKP